MDRGYSVSATKSQACGSGSRFNGVPGSVSGFATRIRIQEGKNDPQKIEKIKKFHVLKFWMFTEGFFCSLEVLYGGLGIIKFLLFFFFNFWS
jgi:hypothetical protein